MMREGRPPALANAPCSRLRSCRMAWTLRTSPPAEISKADGSNAIRYDFKPLGGN